MASTVTVNAAKASASSVFGLTSHGKAVGINYTRNMDKIRHGAVRKVVLPKRTQLVPSPAKASGGSRHPGQSQTRTTVDSAIGYELADARYQSDDLADQMFGHLVSPELVKDILHQFVVDGLVKVSEVTAPKSAPVPLDPHSDGVQRALQQALEDAKRHGCVRLQPTGNNSKSQLPPKTSQTTTFTWQWTSFPPDPIKEDTLVSFLNKITDRAFEIAKPRLATQLRNRFAAPNEKYRPVALAYEADGEDMRPDFLVLPIEAFGEDLETVDEKYINFTALRAVGESKNKDLAGGVEQVQRYARGMRRAQPWLQFVVAMAIAQEKACFLRGDSSGTERLQLALTEGRGCLEFIRVLLGLGLAEPLDLGQNPDIEITSKVCSCRIPGPRRTVPADGERDDPASRDASNPVHTLSSPNVDGATPSSSRQIPHSKPLRSTTKFSQSQRACGDPTKRSSSASKSSKRARSDLGNENDGKRAKKRKINHADRVVFLPVAVYGHKCIGILYTVNSIRGRCTTVFCVVDLDDPQTKLALKISWQDIERLAEQTRVMETLEKHESHPNLIVPIKTIRPTKEDTCTTLGTIRAFLDDQIAGFLVENRLLTVSVSELKRPVKYFWGVHDFVRGLRGALLGHKFLVSIGILHRDFSENNMVLALRPGDERGYLIDLDMAILKEAAKPTEFVLTHEANTFQHIDFEEEDDAPLKQDESKPVKGLRTGTTPYMSFNVLAGGEHTHFDDTESFLYVLLLFFFSYAGPLSKEELLEAHEQGFVQPVGSGRLRHMTNWPTKYASWAEGDFNAISDMKAGALAFSSSVKRLVNSSEMRECLQKNWDSRLRGAILTLLGNAWRLFSNSTRANGAHLDRTEVSHDEFIALLDNWLREFAGMEDEFSNCPFS